MKRIRPSLFALLLLAAPAVHAQFIIYVTDFTRNKSVSKITSDGVVSTFATEFDGIKGLAVDGMGNLYVAGYYKVTPDGAVSVNLNITGLTNFDALDYVALDPQGNLYAADDANVSTVYRVSSAGVVTPFVSGFNGVSALAFDRNGNLYVASYDDENVSKVTPAGVVSTFAFPTGNPSGMAFDRNGNLYVSDIGDGWVNKVSSSGVVSRFVTLESPEGLGFDVDGNLYVATHHIGSPTGGVGTNTVSRVTPAGVVSTFAIGDNYALGSTLSLAIFTPPSIPTSLAIIKGSSANVVLEGWNGTPGTTYYALMSTNLMIPFSQWTRVATNVLDATNALSAAGIFFFDFPIAPGMGQRFYVIGQ